MSIPKWRYVRYTDDGSALYQCLSCYKMWDARTAPGWESPYVDVPEPCEGSNTILQGPEQTPRHYIKLDIPVYKKTWTYCPYCGIAWEGPVRLENDNEYMYGPKRLAVWNKIQERYQRDGWQQPEYTGLWWVIVERSVWRDDTLQAGNVGDWTPKEYARVDLMPAAKMLHFLRDYQARLDSEYNNDPHGYCDYKVKIMTTYVKPKSGYEIRNYDWK